MKSMAAIMVVLLGFGGSLLLFGPGLVDWKAYQPRIAALIERQTGHRLEVDGPIELRILPSPRVALTGARLRPVIDSGAVGRIDVAAINASIAILPLLDGRLQVESLSLVRPTVTVDHVDERLLSWFFGIAGQPRPDMTVRFRTVDIVDGSVIVHQRAGRSDMRLEDLNGTVHAGSQAAPARVALTALYRGSVLGIDISLGTVRDGSIPARFKAEFLEDHGKLEFTGSLAPGAAGRLHGMVVAEAPDLRRLVETLAPGIRGNGTVPATPIQPLKIRARMTAAPDRANLDNIDIQLAGMRMTGLMQANFSEQTEITADVAAGHVDLDQFAWLPVIVRQQADEPGKTITDLPDGITVWLSASAQGVRFGKQLLRDINFDGVLQHGTLEVAVLSASLQAGSTARLAGTLRTRNNDTRFVGNGRLQSDNVRALLTNWGFDLTGVPPDRLHQADVTARFDLSPDRMQFTEWQMALDSSRFAGSLIVHPDERPRFGVNVAADRVNLDAYLKPGERKPMALARMLLSLADSADIGMQTRIEEVALDELVLKGVAFESTVLAGKLEIHDMTVDDVDGTAITMAGALFESDTGIDTDMQLTVESGSAARLARLAGIEVTETIQRIGPARIDGHLRGNRTRLDVTGRIEALGGSADIDATLLVPDGPVLSRMTLQARHPEPERVLAALWDKRVRPGLLPGPGALEMELTARPDDDGYVVDTNLAFTGGEVVFRGVVWPSHPYPAAQAELEFRHPTLARTVQDLLPVRATAVEKSAAASGLIRIEPASDGIRVPAITVNWGDTRFSGEGAVAWLDKRPQISLVTRTDRLLLDQWLPALRLDSISPRLPAPVLLPVRHRDWARESIDLSGLQTFDLSLSVAADRARFGRTEIDDLVADIEIVDGGLAVKGLTGTMAGGNLTASGSFAIDADPGLVIQVGLESVVFGETSETIPARRGVLDYQVRLAATGTSEYELVSAMRGDGHFAIRDGILPGIDLPAFSDSLHLQDSAANLRALAQQKTSSGETGYDLLSGRFNVADGVLEARDVVLETTAAYGRMNLKIDLGTREIDARSRFWFSEYPGSPPVGLRFDGPLQQPRQSLETTEMQNFLLQRMAAAAAHERATRLDRPVTVAPATGLHSEQDYR